MLWLLCCEVRAAGDWGVERWLLSRSHIERTLVVTDKQKLPIMAYSFTVDNLLLGAQGTGQVVTGDISEGSTRGRGS